MTAVARVRASRVGLVGIARAAGVAASATAVAGVAAQLAYPLSGGRLRDVLTIAIVVLLAAAAVAHAAAARGERFALALLAVTAVPGYAFEVLGVHTGFPFGAYEYASSLGPRLFDVPLVVALAWTMLAWPAAVAARLLVHGFLARVAVGAWALAAADLFLDPSMVADGHWRWLHTQPHLPGVPGVPLTNYAGWLLAALVLSALIQLLLRSPLACHGELVDQQAVPATNSPWKAGGDGLPVALYVWLWIGWTVALGFFLDLAAAAAWGALGMGVVAVPLLVRTTRR